MREHEFGRFMRDRREQLGKTQLDIAEAATDLLHEQGLEDTVTQVDVSKMEQGGALGRNPAKFSAVMAALRLSTQEVYEQLGLPFVAPNLVAMSDLTRKYSLLTPEQQKVIDSLLDVLVS